MDKDFLGEVTMLWSRLWGLPEEENISAAALLAPPSSGSRQSERPGGEMHHLAAQSALFYGLHCRRVENLQMQPLIVRSAELLKSS